MKKQAHVGKIIESVLRKGMKELKKNLSTLEEYASNSL